MNQFRIEHITHYRYPSPAMESFAEMRIWPKDTPHQTVHHHSIIVQPQVPVEHHKDYYGNHVESLSVPFRHMELIVTSACQVMVSPHLPATETMEVSLAEARQIFASNRLDYFDFKASSQLVPTDHSFQSYVKEWFPDTKPIGQALIEFNHYIFSRFQYRFGVTDVSTNALQVAECKQGVCQDFAHFMLAVLRSAHIPARYVSGYIETADPTNLTEPELIGSAASHAWVEALLPGEFWLGLDPTNNLIVGDRHIVIATGRDYTDVSPLRGSYRGPHSKELEVKVNVKRILS